MQFAAENQYASVRRMRLMIRSAAAAGRVMIREGRLVVRDVFLADSDRNISLPD
jgi:hypothetical protein